MADIVAKPISVLRQEANTIHEANTRGENTQVRVGGLFQDIVDWLAVNVSSVTLMTPLAQINGEQLSAPTNGQGLVYNDGHWQYGDFGGGGGGGTNTVDWNNITNKPNTFIPSTSYALRKIRQGDIDYLQLTCTENQQTIPISTLEWPSGGGGGDLPSNVVLYTEDSWAGHFEDKDCITTDVLGFNSYSGSGTHYLWLNAQNQLMYDDILLGTGINWGNNVAPENTQPKIEIEGNFYLSGDTGQMGIFHANKVGIANYNSDAEGFVGWRDLEVIDGDLYFAGSKISNSNLDLHLNGSHLYLWDTANESTIGSGVELPTSGGGGGSTGNYIEVDSHGSAEISGDFTANDLIAESFVLIKDSGEESDEYHYIDFVDGVFLVDGSPMVKSINVGGHSVGGEITLVGEGNTTVSEVDGTITISSTGGGGGGITNVKIVDSAASIQDNYAIIPKAGVMQYGVIQLGAYRDAVATCESVGSLASTQNYQLQMDNTGKTFVHVPWTSGSGIPYIKVGQTDVPTTLGSHITLKAGRNVTLTPDTTDDSITIAATGGTGGGVAAINVGGQPVAGIGDTFSMTKTNGISLTPYTNGVLIGADFSSVWQPNNSSTPNQVVAGDLNDDVGTEFLNTDGIRSLLSLLRRIAPNMEITAASNDVDKIQFFGIETLTNGSTLANNSYFYLNGTVEGIPNPVIFYNGSIIKLFLYKEDSTYYYCTWNSNKPSGAHSVDPTTSTSKKTFNNILEAVRQGLYANAGISVTFSSDALYTDSDRARSNMPNVRAKVATRA